MCLAHPEAWRILVNGLITLIDSGGDNQKFDHLEHLNDNYESSIFSPSSLNKYPLSDSMSMIGMLDMSFATFFNYHLTKANE